MTLTPLSVLFGEQDVETEEPREWRGQNFAMFDEIRPGTYNLTFRLEGFPDEFLRLDGLMVEPGQRDRHPRIQDLDLGLYLYRFEINAVDQMSQPIEIRRPQVAKIFRKDGTPQFIGLSLWGDNREVLSTTPQLEVFPQAEGYLAQPQMLGAGVSNLVFQKIPPVELVLPGLSALAGDVPVRVALEQQDLGNRPERLESFDQTSRRVSRWYRWSRYSTGNLGPRDVASVEVAAPGAHKVTVFFGGRRDWRNRIELEPIQVEINPGGPAQQVQLAYDTQQAQEAIAKARQRIQEREQRRQQQGR
jgi:hypothetical protein